MLRTLRLLCLFAASVLPLTTQCLAESGQMHGSVHDLASGEELIGVNILLVGTKTGGVTDLDGKFLIRDIPVGMYDVRISFVGYAAKVVTGVKITGEESFALDVGLTAETYEAEEIVITAERMVQTEAALLAERKRSATISDGFSSESVKRSPDATSGDALKRVTGVSIVDNKFVYVRGVTDRYNSTMLNGVAVTSTDTDTDKKSFAFDMIPANLLENTIISKTATPDLPGDFTGGLVQLKTIDFPTSRVFRLTLAGSYNDRTNSGDIQKSQGGASDWTGKDDGTRAFPTQKLDGYQLGQTLANNWAQRTEKAPLAGNFSLTLGDAIPLGESTLGYVAGLSYRNGYSRTFQQFEYYRNVTSRILEGEGNTDSYRALWGGILDLSMKFAGNNKISFKNSYNQVGQEDVTLSQHIDENEQFVITSDVAWKQRYLYLAKLSGEHYVAGESPFELLWQATYSESKAEEPDRKVTRYARNATIPTDPLSNGLGQRSWSELVEYTRTAGVDLVFHAGDSKIKFGGFGENKTRDYEIVYYLNEPDFKDECGFLALLEPIDSVFRPENFMPGCLTMKRSDDPRDRYDGSHSLLGAYVMADVPFILFSQNLRLVGGVRFENSDIKVHTISPTSFTGDLYTARVKKLDPLPSVNLTYYMSDIMNLRFAMSHSVNRPEFRELSSTYFYDYSINQGKRGNPFLDRAFAKNYDVRFEVFPGVGELVALGYFYKNISGAIEQQVVISANPELTWFNSRSGKNYGWEVEVRKSLDFLGGYFSNFAVSGNYTRVFSQIEYPLFEGATEYGFREMQGQSPWVVNFGFYFTEPALGTTVNVLYNQFGKRLWAVGDQRYLDVFEEPVGVVDFALTQRITSALGMKFAIKNWGAGTRKFITREGNPYRSMVEGTSYSLEASLSL